MWIKTKQSITVNLLIICLGIFLGFNAYHIIRQAFAVKNEVTKEQQKIEVLKSKKSELEAHIRELQTKDAIRREAKQELNLKLPGEEVVVVVPEKGIQAPATSSPPSFWERLKQKFSR